MKPIGVRAQPAPQLGKLALALRSTLRLSLLLAFVCGACLPSLAQSLLTPELEGKPVTRVQFRGNERSSSAYLREQVRLKVGVLFRWEILNDDVKRLYGMGLVEGDIEARAELRDGGVHVSFSVREREVVKGVVFRDLKAVSERELKEQSPGLRTEIGKPYEEYKAELDSQRILEKLRQEGKFFAELDLTLERLQGGGVRVVFSVREGPTVYVDRIRFEGLAGVDPDTIDEDDLRDQMALKEHVPVITTGYFDRRTLDLDLERVATFLRVFGYLDARAFVEELSFTEDRADVDIAIRVKPGERYRIRKAAVRGVTVFDTLELETDLKTLCDKPFDFAEVERKRNALRSRYTDRGHLFASVRLKTRYVADSPAVDLDFLVHEDERIRIDKVRIVGNDRTRDDVIRRELSIYPGDLFSGAELDASRLRLGRLGYFKDVRVSYEPAQASDEREMVMRVVEDDTGQLVFGGGLSSSSGFFGRIMYVQRNFDIADVPTSLDDIVNRYFFVGGGQTMVIQLEPGNEFSRYRARFVEPYLLPDHLPISLQLRTDFSFANSLLARSYAEDRIEGEVGLGYRIAREELIELAYRASVSNIYSVDTFAPADVIDVAGDNIVSSLELAYDVSRNAFDRYRLAYSGHALRFGAEVAGGYLGGGHDFWRLKTSANWQHTMFQWPRYSRHVFALHAEGGIMGPYGRSDNVPIFERFYAGGPRTVRGFEVRSVGPQADDEPVGGRARVVGRAEYSFPLLPSFDRSVAPEWRGDTIRGALFCDVGNVEERIRDFTFDDFRMAIGFGVRVKVPVFPTPVEFNFGFPVRMRAQDDVEIFSFSFGIN